MRFPSIGGPSRLRIILAIFVAGGCFHLLIWEYPTIYENLAGGTAAYLFPVEYEDPLQAVLKNSASHSTRSPTDSSTMKGPITAEDVWTNKTWPFERQPADLEDCPATPPGLVGPIRVWQDGPSYESLTKLYPTLEAGGHGKPENCTANHRVGIIIPYRDRDEHLRVLLHNMHDLLRKQELDYAIIIVEQIANQTFNRAKLMNIGFVEGLRLYPWQCFIFHDVDLLPEDDRNLYTCPVDPRHMSVAVDKFKYQLPYGSIFGGITALTVAQMKSLNGFSNDYWGWGGEDDDISTRVNLAGMKITRYPQTIARYKMIHHVREAKNPINKCRYKLMGRTKARWKRDGLSSLNYKLVKKELLPLYTHLVVDLMEADSKKLLGREITRC